MPITAQVYDLAKASLQGVKGATPEDIQELAELLQRTINDTISAIVSPEEEDDSHEDSYP